MWLLLLLMGPVYLMLMAAYAVFMIIGLIIQLLLMIMVSITASTLGNVISSLIIPSYIKNTLKLIHYNEKNKEAIKEIKKIFLNIYKPYSRRDLLKSLIMLFVLGLSVFLIGKGIINSNNIGWIGVILFLLVGLYAVWDIMFKYMQILTSLLDMKMLFRRDKEIFIKFIYKIYKKYPRYTEYFYDEFRKQYGKAFLRYSMFYFNKKEYYYKFYERNMFPSSKKEQINMIFTMFLENFQKGIEAIEKAERYNLPILK